MTFVERVLDDVGPAFQRRAGVLLEPLVEALTGPLAEVDTLARPSAVDRPWAAVFDLEHTTMPGWMGRVVGTTVPAGLNLEEQRTYVRDQAAWRRGRLDAIAAAVRTLLTGEQRVEILERLDGDAWRIRIRVYDAETTATAEQIKAAATTQKPVGLLIDEVVLAPLISYDDLLGEYGDYSELGDEFDDYEDLTLDDDLAGARWWRPAGHYLRYARLSLAAPSYDDSAALFPTYRDARDHDPTQEA